MEAKNWETIPRDTSGKPEKGNKIKIICSGCKKDMGEKDRGAKEGLISHSYCPECAKKAIEDIENYQG